MRPAASGFAALVAILAVILCATEAADYNNQSALTTSLSSLDNDVRAVYPNAARQAAFGTPALNVVSLSQIILQFSARVRGKGTR